MVLINSRGGINVLAGCPFLQILYSVQLASFSVVVYQCHIPLAWRIVLFPKAILEIRPGMKRLITQHKSNS